MNNGHTTEQRGLARGVGEVVSDLVSLGELQLQLLQCDARDSLHRTMRWLLVAGIGALLLIASFPVALLAVGQVFVHFGGFSTAAGYGLAAAIGGSIAAVLLWAGWWRLSSVMLDFSRSRGEFARNVRWLKQVLRQPSSTPAKRDSKLFRDIQEEV